MRCSPLAHDTDIEQIEYEVPSPLGIIPQPSKVFAVKDATGRLKIVAIDPPPSPFKQDGYTVHYQDGYIHRQHGPAIITSGGTEFHYLNGRRVSESGKLAKPVEAYPVETLPVEVNPVSSLLDSLKPADEVRALQYLNRKEREREEAEVLERNLAMVVPRVVEGIDELIETSAQSIEVGTYPVPEKVAYLVRDDLISKGYKCTVANMASTWIFKISL